MVRRVAGWSLICLALLGMALPVLPGLIFLVFGILVLGPHDPMLRRIAVAIRIVLRRWSQMRQRHMRRLGCFARERYSESRRVVRAHLHRHQHGESGWRTHVSLLLVTLIGLTASAGIMYAVWHTIP